MHARIEEEEEEEEEERRGNGPRRVNTPLQLPNVLLCGANLRIPSSSLFFPQRRKNAKKFHRSQ